MPEIINKGGGYLSEDSKNQDQPQTGIQPLKVIGTPGEEEKSAEEAPEPLRKEGMKTIEPIKTMDNVMPSQPEPQRPSVAPPNQNNHREEKKEQPKKQLKKKPKHQPVFGSKLSKENAEYFMDNIALLLESGVSVGEAVETIATEITNKKVKVQLQQIRTSVDEGKSLTSAMDETGLFAPSALILIDIGEKSGQLVENLKVIALQMHKNNSMNSRIRAAMLYPAFLIILLFVVGTGIGIFLLPKLIKIINGLNEKVGPITKALIKVGTLFGHYGIIIASTIVVLIIVMIVLVRLSPKVRYAGEEVLYHTVGIKNLLFQSEISRLGFVLGTLLNSGLPVIASLQSLESSMTTTRYRKLIAEMRARIDEGSSFGTLLVLPRYRKLLSGTVCQIIISAEKSGSLSESLLKIGDTYQEKADITARNLETLLEPVVLVIIAIAVLFVALAVFLPLYSTIGNFNANQP